MSHFYGSICGNRGDATRMGSKDSGFVAWAQSHYSRITVRYSHDHYTRDKDAAFVTLGDGHSSYNGGTLHLTFDDPTTLVKALGVGDPKMQALKDRITKDIEKLNAEAPKAVARAERKEKAERKQRDAEHAARGSVLV